MDFNKLNLKRFEDTFETSIGSNKVNVKQYLPISEKINLAHFTEMLRSCPKVT